MYITFIGTGISYLHTSNVWLTIAQNLPYGTHIVKSNWTTGGKKTFVDGVEVIDNNALQIEIREFSFHQPKMPPIPEDAVIVADYMLMSDFKPQTGTPSTGQISKGTRKVYNTRDCFYEETANGGISVDHGPSQSTGGFEIYQSTPNPQQNRFRVRCPSFATNYVSKSYQSSTRADMYIDNTEKTGGNVVQSNYGGYETYGHLVSDEVLGVQNWGVSAAAGQNLTFQGFDFATPTHTSSHYQAFETPYLYELVGGDRNMEQNNLVVSADGKTWDEVTRDTSYIGNCVLQISSDLGEVNTGTVVIMDECRGWRTDDKAQHHFNKDFALGYDCAICLRDGEYQIHYGSINRAAGTQAEIRITVNNQYVAKGYGNETEWTHSHISGDLQLKRGDFVKIHGGYWSSTDNSHSEYHIHRLGK
jgi:hypothetical protein